MSSNTPFAAAVALAALVVAGTGAPACSGGGGTEETAPPEVSAGFPEELLEKAWPVAMGDDELRAPYEGAPGWISLVVKRDVKACVADLGRAGGSGAARCHADAAVMYKQAAMLYAWSMVSAWGHMAEDTDPIEGAHLLSVSYALLGDLDNAKAQDARLHPGDLAEPVAAWHTPWHAWLEAGAKWPPDLSALPDELPPVAVGQWPTGAPVPHYVITERSDEKRAVDVSDLSQLVALALWHEAAAREAAEDDAPLDLYGVQYRFPVEGPVSPSVTLPMDYVFGSDYLVPEDAAFLADLLGAAGPGAVDAHKDRSLLAALADGSRVEGKIDPEKAIDLAAETRRLTLARLKEKAGGNTEGFHRTFADIARVAVLRGLALVAEAEGDREISGRLRILALEGSDQEWTADATALLSMAAWDASNEYPVRATESLHNLIRRFPSLEPARFGVDVLALRVSRRRGGGQPGQ